MCYAIPGKVEKIEKNVVTVSYFGEPKKAYSELPHLKIGDYVYAQGGYVLELISPTEAELILSGWKETFFELKKKDAQLSQLDPNQIKKTYFHSLLNKVTNQYHAEGALVSHQNSVLTREEKLFLLQLEHYKDKELLYKTANFLRQTYQQNSCCVHGIIEISNDCGQNCFYCGIRAENHHLKRYRLSTDEILSACQEAIETYGFRSLVLQSGEDPALTVPYLKELIYKIKARWPVLIFISFGEIGLEGLEELYQAGARGLLMRFETSNSRFYQRYRPGHFLETRLAHLKKAYECGYLIITGSLIGLPDYTPDDILNDIELAESLHAEMISIGPLIPHPETSFANQPMVNEDMVLKTLALARISDPNNKILVTTSFETLSPTARQKGLLAGANSVMLNATPLAYRPFYSIYPKRAHEKESLDQQIEETIGLLKLLGRAPTDLSIGVT